MPLARPRARVGAPRGAASAHPLPGGERGGPLPRPRRDRRVASTRCTPATATRGRRSPRPFVDALRGGARHDAVRLPADRRPAAAAAPARARCGCCDFARLLPELGGRPRPAAVRGRRLARLAATARRCTATRRRTAPARRSPAFYLNLLGHAVGWPSPRGGAGRLTDALVALPREPRRRGPHRRARRRASLSAGGRVTGVAIAADERVRGADRGRRRHAARAARAMADALPGWYRTALQPLRATAPRRSRSTGRSTARSRGRTPDVARRRAPCTSPAARTSSCASVEQSARRPRRPPVPAARPAERRRPDPRARGQAHGLGLHARPAAGRRLGRARRRASSSAWRRRSSASPPASATASSPATSSARADLEARNANLVGGDVGGGSYALRQVVFRPVPEALALPHAARRACSSAAPRRSRAARSTACPGDAAARAALR